MKKVLVVFLILALVLSGCGWNGAGAQSTDPTEDAAPSEQVQPPTQEQTPVPEAPAEKPTEEPTEKPSEEPTEESTETPEPEGTLEQVRWAGFMIFAEPTLDSQPVQPLPVGTYTMVDAQQDDEGLDWGKLKSGLGWICLTEIRLFNGPASIGQADEQIHGKAAFSNVYEDAPYGIPVVIHACEDLKDLQVYTCQLGESEMEADELIYEQESLEKKELLVLELSFPGDFSCYELRFTDEAGVARRYLVSVNGRNGTIFAWERIVQN